MIPGSGYNDGVMPILSSVIFIVTLGPSSVQKEIEAQYKRWDRAIVKQDQKTMNDILADTFQAIRKNGKKPHTKKEFIDGIAAKWKTKGPKEKSFTTKLVKLTHKEDTYFATVRETIIFEPVNGKSEKIEFTSIDTWQMYGKAWRITRTEPGD